MKDPFQADRLSMNNNPKILICAQQAGLTFIELMIVLATMAIIMGGLTTALISQSRMSVSEEELIDLQMNLRVATDRLTSILAHTGFGNFNSFNDGHTMTGTDPAGGTISINSSLSNITNQDSEDDNINSDSLIIVYGFRAIARIDSIIEEDKVKLTPFRQSSSISPSITTGNDFKRYLSFTPGMDGNSFYQVSAVNGNDVTFNRSIPVEEDYVVYMVSPVRIHLVNNSLHAQIFAYQAAVASEQFWLIAENIEDMQFQYHIDGKWADSVSASDLQKVRMVRFWLLGRSAKPVRESSTQIYELIDLVDNMADPAACVDKYEEDDIEYCVIYRVGPFNDGRMRMLSRSEVVLRNAF